MRFLDEQENELAGQDVPALLSKAGIVRFTAAELGELEGFLATWSDPYHHPGDAKPGLTLLEPKPSAQPGATRERQDLHTDRAFFDPPPAFVANLMLQEADAGGEGMLLDGYDTLSAVVAAGLYAAAGDMVIRTSSGRVCPVFRVLDGTYCRIRYRNDEVARPGGISRMGRQLLDLFHQSLASRRVIPLRQGDGYIVHNHRYLHGRTAFSGTRRLARFQVTVKPGSPYRWMNSGFDASEILRQPAAGEPEG
jgi:hypothetical protein